MQDKVEYEKREKLIVIWKIDLNLRFFLLGVREQAARFRATDI
jgi:hypothetical protein